ncbi:PAS domain-containing sensor histidine kinase [Hymenobacter sp. YC55]|uniref:PAS domain-containing sensor histidine kinase n=1 Tax=Hymenobacter sp. YC55 TaxID=3034019 RepID=UPI0023F7053B|nr:PAS domain-containing sensor histidine kinase [Hymenobacter sp. YC55]MDF7815416.1 PAS domain-containing protein [Hymenobacter sp. YC55]
MAAPWQGEQLSASFTDTAGYDRIPVEIALRASQAAEKAARADAEAQRQRFYEVLMQLPASVAVYHGPEHVFTFINPHFEAFVPGLAVLGRPVREAAQGAVGTEVFERLDRVYATGEAMYLPELEVHLAADQTNWLCPLFVSASYPPLRDDKGHIIGVLDFSYDVTAQVLARQGLKMLAEQLRILNEELEHRVETRTQSLRVHAAEARRAHAAQRWTQEHETPYQLFTQTPALIALLREPGHRFEYCNAAYQQLFPGRTLLGRIMAVPEAVEQGFIALLDIVFQTGNTHFGSETAFAVAATGDEPARTRYYSFTYQAYRVGGRIVGVSIFAYDVTERVVGRAGNEARREQLERLFMQAPAAICIFAGPELIFEFVNSGYQQLFPGRQLLGQPLLAALPEMAGHLSYENLRLVYETGRSHEVQNLLVPIARPGDGALEDRYFNYIQQARHNEQGQVDGVVAFAYETTAQVLASQQVLALNAELSASNEQLRRTNADLDTFVYTASHDLKTPVANIEGLLLALRDELPPTARQAGVVQPLLDRMQGAVERFQLTIAQLTDVARLQLAQAQPATTVDLAALVDELRLELAPLLANTNAQLALDVAACPQVSFAPQHLRSIVYHLLSNAVKYRHPDRSPRVRLRCRSTAANVVLEVEDNGLGLSKTQQSQLFGLFRRLHDHVEGTGLGLYTVKRLVENVGGTITVVSQTDVGSTFTVTLPRTDQLGEKN